MHILGITQDIFSGKNLSSHGISQMYYVNVFTLSQIKHFF